MGQSQDPLDQPLGQPTEREKKTSSFMEKGVFFLSLFFLSGALSFLVFYEFTPLSEQKALLASQASSLNPEEKSDISLRSSQTTSPLSSSFSLPASLPEAEEKKKNLENGVRIIRSDPQNQDPSSPIILSIPSDYDSLTTSSLPDPLPDTRARVSIVLTGVGLNPDITQKILHDFPPSLSLAFAPYGSDLQKQVLQAQKNGFEILLQIPLESTQGPRSETPHELRTEDSPQHMRRHLQWLMTRFSGYRGLIAFQGSQFVTSRAHVRALLAELKEKELYYVEDGQTEGSLVPKVAQDLHVPFLKADYRFDSLDASWKEDQFTEQLEALLHQKDSALIVLPCFPSSLERLPFLLRQFREKNIVLVPLSHLLPLSKKI